jgi:predicted ribosome quality control (RQC) complex YloA/Tae2 family protein
MIRHFYTLQKIAVELQFLCGCELVECYTQDKDSVVLVFYDKVKFYAIQFSADTQFASLYLRTNFARARKNTVDLFPDLKGETLQNISLKKNDRIIQFGFINSDLFGILFGGGKSNLIATNHDKRIFDSLKHKTELVDNNLELPDSKLRPIYDFPDETKIIDVIANCECLTGKYYSKEICSRMNINPQTPKSLFSTDDFNNIKNEIGKLRSECINSSEFYLLMNSRKEVVLSLIPLKDFPNVLETYDDINEAVQKRIIYNIKNSQFSTSYTNLYKKFNFLKKKIENNIAQIKDEASALERAEKYKLWAELLMAQPNPKFKPGDKIKLNSWDGQEIEIQLDPKLNLLENGTKYYDKVRNTKESQRYRQKRLPEFELRLLKIDKALKDLNSSTNMKDIANFEKNFKNITGTAMNKEQMEQTTQFREFDLGDGFILYVGKNAANNDELTMHFAKPNDIWLHARGSGGSHCVLRLNSNEKPPKPILKKAAEIAAYYSQARKAKYTPVAYTFKKYVHKPKGANTGSVVISREEVIMAEPKLPEGEEKE